MSQYTYYKKSANKTLTEPVLTFGEIRESTMFFFYHGEDTNPNELWDKSGENKALSLFDDQVKSVKNDAKVVVFK